MNTLESLVPPMEVCKKIPAGKFEDSALVWNTTVCDEETGEICGVHERDACDSFMRGNQVPAPTLAEIMEELTEYPPITIKQWRTGHIEVACNVNGLEVERYGYNPTNAALKLWLELNKEQ